MSFNPIIRDGKRKDAETITVGSISGGENVDENQSIGKKSSNEFVFF